MNDCFVVIVAALVWNLMWPLQLDYAERNLRECQPTGTDNDELLELMRVTRTNRRAWIMDHQPTITDIIQRYPRLIDVPQAVSTVDCYSQY